MDNNNYGALNNDQDDGKRQRFDILEPHYERQAKCCHSNTDGFKIIVISMFVFAVGVTVALIITIASGKSINNCSSVSLNKEYDGKILENLQNQHLKYTMLMWSLPTMSIAQMLGNMSFKR